MQLSLENSPGYTIHAYGPEGITLILPRGEVPLNPPRRDAGFVDEGMDILTGGFLLSPGGLMRDWGPGSFEALTREHFAALAELPVAILILGTGARARLPHPRLGAPLAEAGIGLEAMDTAAACRTYNVLLGEGRVVAAAFLPLGAN